MHVQSCISSVFCAEGAGRCERSPIRTERKASRLRRESRDSDMGSCCSVCDASLLSRGVSAEQARLCLDTQRCTLKLVLALQVISLWEGVTASHPLLMPVVS